MAVAPLSRARTDRRSAGPRRSTSAGPDPGTPSIPAFRERSASLPSSRIPARRLDPQPLRHLPGHFDVPDRSRVPLAQPGAEGEINAVQGRISARIAVEISVAAIRRGWHGGTAGAQPAALEGIPRGSEEDQIAAVRVIEPELSGSFAQDSAGHRMVAVDSPTGAEGAQVREQPRAVR